jgi:hypothetical protein
MSFETLRMIGQEECGRFESPFGPAQGRHFDPAQERPFDPAQDRPSGEQPG